MAKNTCFQFKQFAVDQRNCAMKITTDAILFGAMVDISKRHSVLDIGSGTGLLSLMMAQRTEARITAIELDQAAARQSSENIQGSPWSDQIGIVNDSIQNFSAETLLQFDCIVTNPPFFQDSLKGPDSKRNQARHTDTLSFTSLAQAINRCLLSTGKAWVLLPVDSGKKFLQAACWHDLYPEAITEVQSSANHPCHRWVITLSRKQGKLKKNSLTIYQKPPVYSEEFRQLTSDYYLNI